jgi:hypothetical protein
LPKTGSNLLPSSGNSKPHGVTRTLIVVIFMYVCLTKMLVAYSR